MVASCLLQSLARRFAITPQSMNETIATLEQKQLVVRTVAGEKAPNLHISLTPEGVQLLKAARSGGRPHGKRLFSALSAAEIGIRSGTR